MSGAITPIADPRTSGDGITPIADPRRTAPGVPAGVSSYLNRAIPAFGAGMASPIAGAAQLLGKAISEIPGVGPQDWAARFAAANLAMQNKAPEAALAGTILSPLNLLGPETVGGSRVLAGMLGGAAAGAAQPVEAGRKFWQDKIKQAAAGGTLGTMAGTAAKVLAKTSSTPAAALAREGVRVPLGSMAGTVGDIAAHSVDLSPGRLVRMITLRNAQSDLQRKFVFDWVLGPFRGMMPKNVTGRDAIGALQNAASQLYDRALGSEPLAYPKFIAQHLRQVTEREWKQSPAQTLSEVFGLRHELDILPPTARDYVHYALSKYAARDFEERGFSMPPRDLKRIQSDLRKVARGWRRSNGPGQPEAASFLNDFLDHVGDAIADANPGRAAALRAADSVWSRLTVVEDALPTLGTESHPAGVLPLNDLLRAMEKHDLSVRNRAFAAGNAPGQRALEAAAQAIPAPSALAGISPLLGGLAVYGLGHAAAGPVGGAAALAASAGLPALGNALRPVFASPVAASIAGRTGGPASAAVGSLLGQQ